MTSATVSAGRARTTPATRTPAADAIAPSTRLARGRTPRNAIPQSAMIRPRWVSLDLELEAARRGRVRREVAEAGCEQEDERERQPRRQREEDHPEAEQAERRDHSQARARGSTRDDEGRRHGAGAEHAEEEPAGGRGAAELVGEGGCERVDRVGCEPDDRDDEQVDGQPRLAPDQLHALSQP